MKKIHKYVITCLYFAFITISATSFTLQSEGLPDLDTLEFVECSIRTPSPNELIGKTKKMLPGQKKMKKIFNSSQSTNWAGYVGVSNLKNPATNSVSQIAAQWTVPSVTGSTIDTYSSIWVGIDGYNNGTVEQLGTEQDWSGGSPYFYAWYEMYPGPSYVIDFPPGKELAAGDVVGAHVVYLGNNVYDLLFANYTKGIKITVPHDETISSQGARSSAEWIVEAPASGSVLPLAEFFTHAVSNPTITMSNCNATINGIHALVGNNYWQCDSLTMVTPQGGIKAATSSLTPNAGSFFVTWHSN